MSNVNQPPFNPPYSPPPKPDMTGYAPVGYPPQMGPGPYEQPPKKKTGCTCVGCILGCAGVMVVLLIAAGIGGYMFVRRLPDITRNAVHQAIDQSDLPAEDKKVVMTQVDRLVDGYKEGKIDMKKLGEFGQRFMHSPLMDLMLTYAAKAQYIDKSGLTDDEKKEAELTIQRVARAVIEERVEEDELDVALNHISNDLGNGNRQFRDQVSDEELRAFLQECKRIADEAEVPDEPYQVDIGKELKKLVDEALGEETLSEEDASEPPTAEADDANVPAPPAVEPPTSPTPPDPPIEAEKPIE